MRDTVIKYVTNLKLRGFQVSQELPFDADGNPLYVKNPKRIYVDQDQVSRKNELLSMSGFRLDREVVIVKIYVATDAKQAPQEINTLVTNLTDLKKIDQINKYSERHSNTETEFINDLLVTKIELTFERLIN